MNRQGYLLAGACARSAMQSNKQRHQLALQHKLFEAEL